LLIVEFFHAVKVRHFVSFLISGNRFTALNPRLNSAIREGFSGAISHGCYRHLQYMKPWGSFKQ
jgi:hypothetical protein